VRLLDAAVLGRFSFTTKTPSTPSFTKKKGIAHNGTMKQ
jgi:hypothetical protein